MILDATKKAEQRALLEAELEAVGIRLNRDPPSVKPNLSKRIFSHISKEHLPQAEESWWNEDYIPSTAEEPGRENVVQHLAGLQNAQLRGTGPR